MADTITKSGTLSTVGIEKISSKWRGWGSASGGSGQFENATRFFGLQFYLWFTLK